MTELFSRFFFRHQRKKRKKLHQHKKKMKQSWQPKCTSSSPHLLSFSHPQLELASVSPSLSLTLSLSFSLLLSLPLSPLCYSLSFLSSLCFCLTLCPSLRVSQHSYGGNLSQAQSCCLFCRTFEKLCAQSSSIEVFTIYDICEIRAIQKFRCARIRTKTFGPI